MSRPSAAAPDRSEITSLLLAWRDGDRAALDRLVPLVEADLRRSAHRYLRRERPGHVLQTTALVNEAYIRLLRWKQVGWQNRAHFLAMAARLMRNVLVEMSRRRAKDHKGLPIRFVYLSEPPAAAASKPSDVSQIDAALQALSVRDARKAQIVELRFFGGLTLDEIAEVIGASPASVSREWAKARAWLHRELSGQEASP